VWEDCGTVPAVLQTNRYLLGQLDVTEAPGVGDDVVLVDPVTVEEGAVVRRSVLGPHVHVGAGAVVEGSVVGPFVSLAPGSRVVRSLVYDAIVDAGGSIEDAALTASLVGESARVRGSFSRFNVGDSSEIDAGPPNAAGMLGAPEAAEPDA
jgi:glucose-1-phosphate thymidylyltransferase